MKAVDKDDTNAFLSIAVIYRARLGGVEKKTTWMISFVVSTGYVSAWQFRDEFSEIFTKAEFELFTPLYLPLVSNRLMPIFSHAVRRLGILIDYVGRLRLKISMPIKPAKPTLLCLGCPG